MIISSLLQTDILFLLFADLGLHLLDQLFVVHSQPSLFIQLLRHRSDCVICWGIRLRRSIIGSLILVQQLADLLFKRQLAEKTTGDQGEPRYEVGFILLVDLTRGTALVVIDALSTASQPARVV